MEGARMRRLPGVMSCVRRGAQGDVPGFVPTGDESAFLQAIAAELGMAEGGRRAPGLSCGMGGFPGAAKLMSVFRGGGVYNSDLRRTGVWWSGL